MHGPAPPRDLPFGHAAKNLEKNPAIHVHFFARNPIARME
jgi:hypothetical protein